MFCMLCLSNFHPSNPEKIEKSISYQVGPKVFLATLHFASMVSQGYELCFACCACQTSRVLTPKKLYNTFPTKLAERFLNKAALLFGEFEGFCLNFKAIFCTLCLSNFPSSNPFMPGWPKDF